MVVVVDELVDPGLGLVELGDGERRWRRNHFFSVCWNRSTLPQVWGWTGRRGLGGRADQAEVGLEEDSRPRSVRRSSVRYR